MDEAASEDALACTMTEVNESATRYIESVMPAVRIQIFPSVLYPTEDLGKRLVFELSVCEHFLSLKTHLAYRIQSSNLADADVIIGGQLLKGCITCLNLSHIILTEGIHESIIELLLQYVEIA